MPEVDVGRNLKHSPPKIARAYMYMYDKRRKTCFFAVSPQKSAKGQSFWSAQELTPNKTFGVYMTFLFPS